jgi:acyl-CoA thioester hydrolase
MDREQRQHDGDPDAAMNLSRIRVRMFHTDLVGGVFHGRYFDLFEEARTEAFRRAGFHWNMTHEDGIAFVVVQADCRYFRPTAMDDELEIAVFVTKLGRARCTVEYEVRRAGDPPLLALGHTAFAFYDTHRGKLVAIPASVREAVYRCRGLLRLEVDRGEEDAGPRRASRH